MLFSRHLGEALRLTNDGLQQARVRVLRVADLVLVNDDGVEVDGVVGYAHGWESHDVVSVHFPEKMEANVIASLHFMEAMSAINVRRKVGYQCQA